MSALAIAAIAGTSLLMAVLPAAFALRLLALPPEWIAAGLAVLGAGLGGVKLIAMAWAIGGRLAAPHPAEAVAAAD